MEYSNLLVDIKDQILFITIHREKSLNALNRSTISELGVAIQELYENQTLKGAIISGTGEKAFVAGADITEFKQLSSDQGKEMAQNGHNVFRKIETAPKPVIALVHGYALGGGCELAMACHLRIATERAAFGQPEVNLGIIPGYGGTQRLVQLIGKGKALELLMTGDMIRAQQALELGLVNHLMPTKEAAKEKAIAIINKIAGKAPIAIAKVIDAVDAFFHKERDGYSVEIEHFSSCISTEDFKEGTNAFIEKRTPIFAHK